MINLLIAFWDISEAGCYKNHRQRIAFQGGEIDLILEMKESKDGTVTTPWRDMAFTVEEFKNNISKHIRHERS